MTAIQAIKEYEGPIESIEDLDNINGLAKGSIKERIKEFIESGNISQVRQLVGMRGLMAALRMSLNLVGLYLSLSKLLFLLF